MKVLHVEIITPQGLLYESDCDSVSVMTSQGEVTILPDHVLLITPISYGEVHITKDKEIIPFAISEGVLQVKENNKVILLVESSERAEEVDTDALQDAIERAQKAMQEKDNTMDIDFARFQSQIERDLNKVRVAKKWRK